MDIPCIINSVTYFNRFHLNADIHVQVLPSAVEEYLKRIRVQNELFEDELKECDELIQHEGPVSDAGINVHVIHHPHYLPMAPEKTLPEILSAAFVAL